MKSIVMPENEQFNEKTNAQELLAEVKETLSRTADNSNTTKFTANDMWNRNRKSRSASDRIRRWNLN